MFYADMEPHVVSGPRVQRRREQGLLPLYTSCNEMGEEERPCP